MSCIFRMLWSLYRYFKELSPKIEYLISLNYDYYRVESTLVINFTIILDLISIQDTTVPDVQDTFLSDLPEGVIEYNLCPYLSNRDIMKITYLKNYHLREIASRVLSKRDEKCKL